MKKNLIYYSFNSDYEELFMLHLKSLLQFDNSGFDYVVLKIPDATPFEASTNKLKIYQHDLSNYENVLFCDVDTIWNKSPNDVFKAISDTKISVVNEQQLMNHPAGYWGEYLLTEKQKKDITEKGILGINTGVFGFKSKMAEVFEEIEKFMQQNASLHNALYEQPFMNVYLYANNLIDGSLNNFVANSYDGSFEDKHLIHFLGGSKEEKLEKMRR